MVQFGEKSRELFLIKATTNSPHSPIPKLCSFATSYSSPSTPHTLTHALKSTLQMEKKPVSSLQTSLLRAFSRALRLAEFSIAIFLLAYATRHLPALFSSLRRLATGLLHPHFIFLLGNSIVALLLHLSRHLPSSSSTSASPPLYQELIQAHDSLVASASSQQEVIFEDKEAVSVEPRKFTRSKSERYEKKRKGEKELRRSDTELKVKEKRNGEQLEEEDWRPSVEEADEFRKMIEEFIAKQAKFHREESMAIVGA